MKKYIYSPLHQGAVLAPLMEKPRYFYEQTHMESIEYRKRESAYNTWLSSPPAFKVRPEDIEWFSVERGEDEFEVQYFVKTESYQGEGGRLFKTLMEAEKKYDEWSKYDGKLQSFAYPPQQVAIPKKGNESCEPSQLQTSEPVASHSSGVGNSIGRLSSVVMEIENARMANAKGMKDDCDLRLYNVTIEIYRIVDSIEQNLLGNESKEQSPSIDLDRVVYVPVSVDDELPPKGNIYNCLTTYEVPDDADYIQSISYNIIDRKEFHKSKDGATVTHWLKKTTIRELIHQPYK
jgi:hypothetical protein